jgi:hypothetical protein
MKSLYFALFCSCFFVLFPPVSPQIAASPLRAGQIKKWPTAGFKINAKDESGEIVDADIGRRRSQAAGERAAVRMLSRLLKSQRYGGRISYTIYFSFLKPDGGARAKPRPMSTASIVSVAWMRPLKVL